MRKEQRVAFALLEPFYSVDRILPAPRRPRPNGSRSRSFHNRFRTRRRPGVLRRRRLPGEASRRSSDTRIGAGNAAHSIDKGSLATTLACASHSTRIATLCSSSASHSRTAPSSLLCRPRVSRAAGVVTLTLTAVPEADRKIRRTRPSAVRRRRMRLTVGVDCRRRRTRPSAARRRKISDIHTPPP